MLTVSRALRLNVDAGEPLPHVDDLDGLYHIGFDPRHGQLIMVAGQSGSQKSGFVMWWVTQLDLPTLYFSGDMSAFTASTRIAQMFTGYDKQELSAAMKGTRAGEVVRALEDSKIHFAFGSPITWRAVQEELEAYVEIYNAFPSVIVFDNLMDFAGAEAGYDVQMETMQYLTDLTRDTGSTVIVTHHATDKVEPKKGDHPYKPPARKEIKNGLGEKPDATLTVQLDPQTLEFHVAPVKQRDGACDKSGATFATLQAQPELTRFHYKKSRRYL